MKRRVTKSIRDAKAFCVRAKELKAARTIAPDCRLPDSIAEIEAGRKPAPKQLDTIATIKASRQGACNTEPALTKPQTYEGGSRHGYCTF